MAQLDKSDHSTPDVQSCSVLDLAAHAAAQQKSARGTLSELADQGRSCAPIPKFESTDDLLAAYKQGKANGQPDMVAFEMLGKGDSHDYVKDSIGSLENAMGYGSNVLDYMWFKDDNGNADDELMRLVHKIFAFGWNMQKSEMTSRYPSTATACAKYQLGTNINASTASCRDCTH